MPVLKMCNFFAKNVTIGSGIDQTKIAILGTKILSSPKQAFLEHPVHETTYILAYRLGTF